MARILRGDIVWADLNPVRGREQAGHRPVVVVSEDVFNARSGTVIAMAITSQPQQVDFPLAFELTNSKLPKRSWVKISQIRTLSTERIGKRIGRVSPEELNRLIEGLNEIVGWSR
jgi:mRNA interferase MazF